jgi:nucleoid DNA-binding protein
MVANATGRHLYIEDLVPLVSAKTGISQRQTRKTISAFCSTVGEQLGDGHSVTLRGLGALRVKGIKSYWRTDLIESRILG